MTTFGFEAEFVNGPDRVIQALTERGYAQQTPSGSSRSGLHGYHCDCSSCSDLYGVRFRAQRDSSCGGEIISGIFDSDHWDVATDCMHALQEAALDVDATIDTSCGMHVHIGSIDGTELAVPSILSMAWLGLEPILWEHVAGSAWARRRGSQNNLLSSAMLEHMMCSPIWNRYDVYPRDELDLDNTSATFREAYVAAFRNMLESMRWDRHCDLARAAHGGVYEIRIFNATRVAWRIELACRLSVALCDPEVAGHFAEKTDRFLFGQEAQLGTRMKTLRNGYRRQGRAYRDDAPLQAVLPITIDDFMDTLTDFDETLGELLRKQTGYTAARKAVGIVQGQIGNTLDPNLWNHSAVLAALNPTEAVDA
jgi:hypothetical protein